jgi:hypothetical protein
MSCNTYNIAVDSCDYNSVSADGQITAGKNSNDLQFYGLIGGPGVTITKTTNTVNIAQGPIYGQKAMHMKLGTQPYIHFGTLIYKPVLSTGGFGEFNNGIYVNDVINTLISDVCFVSVNINYVGDGIIFRLEDEDGNVYMKIENRNSYTKPNTLSGSTSLNIPLGVKLIPIIVRLGPGTLFLQNSHISFGYY